MLSAKSKIEQSIRREYERQQLIYKALEGEVHNLVEETCKKNKWIFLSRLKEPESYALKLLTGRTNRYEIDDFFACTIIVPNLKGVEPAISLVKACFDVKSEKPGEYINNRPTEFNFDDIRLYCTLKQAIQEKIYSKSLFEVQIKTLLEHAWSEATHDFSYKGNNISWARERLAAQIKAILNNVDISILNMEEISNSYVLSKRSKKYEEISNILDFLQTEFVENEDFIAIGLPRDRKRLAEEIWRLLNRVELSLSELESYLLEETKEGRGYKTRNLSIYSIILVSIFKQNEKKFICSLSKQPQKRNEPKIIIPYETMIKELCDISKLKGATFLE